jgi:hypothetical protein
MIDPSATSDTAGSDSAPVFIVGKPPDHSSSVLDDDSHREISQKARVKFVALNIQPAAPSELTTSHTIAQQDLQTATEQALKNQETELLTKSPVQTLQTSKPASNFASQPQ